MKSAWILGQPKPLRTAPYDPMWGQSSMWNRKNPTVETAISWEPLASLQAIRTFSDHPVGVETMMNRTGPWPALTVYMSRPLSLPFLSLKLTSCLKMNSGLYIAGVLEKKDDSSMSWCEKQQETRILSLPIRNVALMAKGMRQFVLEPAVSNHGLAT